MTLFEQFMESLTTECDEPDCFKGKNKYGSMCWGCHGAGRVLTSAGKKLMEFIKEFGDFAEKDHSHTLS